MLKQKKILIVDDEEDMLGTCVQALRKLNLSFITTSDSNEAINLLKTECPDLVLTDLKMSKKDGLQILKEVKDFNKDIIVVLFTAYGSIENAVAAIKKGAFDYITKPFTSEQLRIVIQRALKQKNLEEENKNLKQQIKSSFNFTNIIGQSIDFKKILTLAEKVAKKNINVFIYGETGTGKELIAHAIHVNSERFNQPFIVVDCAALPENLLESELFGYEKGAFTGAYSSHKGLFEHAHDGTLFLDEIGELSVNLQAKLLRVLQEKVIRRLGSNEIIKVDFRVVSATNRDIEKEIENFNFREDLFFRLNVVSITIPTLRERKEDIPLLAKYFLNKYSKETSYTITKQAMEKLINYFWPGNVRELENVIQSAITLSDKTLIDIDDLPEKIIKEISAKDNINSDFSYKTMKQKWASQPEKNYILELLKRNQGNISKAAKEANVDRKTFYKLLHKYKINYE